MRIAIVGADGTKWKEKQIPKAMREIEGILRRNATEQVLKDNIDVNPLFAVSEGCKLLTLVSGHCLKGGIDIWAEEDADKLGIKKEIYSAEVNQFPDLRGTICPKCGFEQNSSMSFGDALKRLNYHSLSCDGKLQDYTKKGYRSRNIQIAEAGLKELIGRPIIGLKDRDNYVLYDIEPAKSCSHCGGKSWMNREVPVVQWQKGVKVTVATKKCWACEGDGAYSGGTWTLKYARKLGREVHKVVIE
jgi:hypothetical protein